LKGKELSNDQLGQAAKVASSEISPISDVRSSKDYRRRMTEVLVRRALMAARDELAGTGSND
jgi:carbon-monoxide dehydrogenase medium subunit